MDDCLPLKTRFDLLAAANSFPMDTGFLASCRSCLKLDVKSLICQMSRKAHYSEGHSEGQGYLGLSAGRWAGEWKLGSTWEEEEESSISEP